MTMRQEALNICEWYVDKKDLYEFIVQQDRQKINNMTIKHTIAQEIFTNSVLISPLSEDHPLQQFFWRRRNCYFSSSFEEKIMQVEKQLSYQCSILDYSATIELVTIDQQNRKTLYSYGPVKLQPELETHPFLPAPRYSLTIYLRGQHVPVHLTFEPAPSYTFIHLSLPNHHQVTLRYPQNSTHPDGAIFALEAIPPRHMLLAPPEDPNAFKFILQDMNFPVKYAPKHIELVFDDQFTRDLCGLQILIAMGYQFEGLRCENTLKLWKTHYRYEHQQTAFQQHHEQNLDFEASNFPNQSILPHQITNQAEYQLEHLLDNPKGNQSSMKHFNPEKVERNGFHQEIKHKISDHPSTSTTQTKGKKKMPVQKVGKKAFGKVQHTRNMNSPSKDHHEDPFIHEKYLISLRRNQQLQQQNKRLKQINEQLMKKVKEYERKAENKKDVPGFIKQLEINKAIKKVADDANDEKIVRYMTSKVSPKKSQKNSEQSSMDGQSRLRTWNVSKLLHSGKGQSIYSYSPPQSQKGKHWEWKEPGKDKRSSMKSLGMKFFLNFQNPVRDKSRSHEKDKKGQRSKEKGWNFSKNNKSKKNDNI